jgi:hypothetical protein
MPYILHFIDLTSLEIKTKVIMEVNDLHWGQIIKMTTKHESSYQKTYQWTPNMPFILHFIDLTSLEVKMEVIMEVNDLQWGQIIEMTTKHEFSYPKTYKWTTNIPYILHFIDLTTLDVKTEVIMEVNDLQWSQIIKMTTKHEFSYPKT